MPDYVTVADLAYYLHASAGSLEPNLAQLALKSAQELIQDVVERPITAEDAVELYDGNGTESLVMRGFPVTGVTEVAVRNSNNEAASEVILTADQYTLDAQRGILWRISDVFDMGHQNVTVTYSYGEDPFPFRVKVVALQVAARIYDFGMAQNETVGSWSASYVLGAANLTPDERMILASLRSKV